jgi:hypothetical protein
MPLFTYTATNDDNKEVRGTIESPDESNARRALEDLQLDVIQISEASRTKPASEVPAPSAQLPSFAFEGTDGSGSVRRGSIQAQTKYEAFKRLRDDQKLFLSMLSPVGVLPQYNDPELDQWQRGIKAQSTPVMHSPEPKKPSQTPAKALPARPPVGFTNIQEPPKKPTTQVAAPPSTATGGYHPIASTLRLYGGWLLAWYGIFVAAGYYSVQRALPWEIPFVQAFYLSPLIFSFIVAIFLFLMMSAVHKALRGGLILGVTCAILGIATFVGITIVV